MWSTSGVRYGRLPGGRLPGSDQVKGDASPGRKGVAGTGVFTGR
ncbi:hypothetical protein AB4Z54_54210 [Streptomyces sp. MCAF7]